MSILLGPYEQGDPSEVTVEEELLVFGYACKLYRDDAKALLEDSGQLLIPWMGDGSLMIDRYDVRNRLDDKAQFGLKSSIPYWMSEEDEEFEEMLDRERYLALECDELRVEEEEEVEKRLLAQRDDTSFRAVGFSYDREATPPKKDSFLLMSHPQLPEHPPTSSVDIGGEDDIFTPPSGLVVPEELQLPATNKLHSIIERTALFISRQGTQMEIIIKAKQKFNPFFSFLDYGDDLNPYYRHLLRLISTGAYIPRSQSPNHVKSEEGEQLPGESGGITPDGVESKVKEEPRLAIEYESSSDESEEEGFELHPLLRASASRGSSKPATPNTEVDSAVENGADSVGEVGTSGGVFYTRSLAVNSAPSLESDTADVDAPRTSEEAPGDYQYSQQYPYPYGRYITGQEEYYATATSYYNAYGYQAGHSHLSYDDHLQSYYQALSASHISTLGDESGSGVSGPTPPPPDLQPIVDKTAEYVARNSDGFERTVLEKHCGDSRFSFLNPWDQYHAYYQMKKQQFLKKIVAEDKENSLKEKPNVQKLSSSGTISFKLPAKSSKLLAPTVDLSTGDDDEYEEEEGGEGQRRRSESIDNGLGEAGPPPAKRQCRDEEDKGGEEEEEDEEGDKIGCKVQEFLSTVKAMFGTD